MPILYFYSESFFGVFQKPSCVSVCLQKRCCGSNGCGPVLAELGYIQIRCWGCFVLLKHLNQEVTTRVQACQGPSKQPTRVCWINIVNISQGWKLDASTSRSIVNASRVKYIRALPPNEGFNKLHMTAAAAAAAPATVMYRLTTKKLNVFIRISLWRGAQNIVWCTPDGRLLIFLNLFLATFLTKQLNFYRNSALTT